MSALRKYTRFRDPNGVKVYVPPFKRIQTQAGTVRVQPWEHQRPRLFLYLSGVELLLRVQGSCRHLESQLHSSQQEEKKTRKSVSGDILMARLSHIAILSYKYLPSCFLRSCCHLEHPHKRKLLRSALPFLLSIRIQLRLGLLKCPCDLCWTSHSHPWVFLSHFSSWLHQQIA